MSALAEFYNAARLAKRELTGNPRDILTQEDVDAIKAATEARWKPVERETEPMGLSDPQAFFGVVRRSFGALRQKQVEGFNVLLNAMGKARWSLAWVAYGLATAWWETAKTMQPVKEAYWLSEAWREKNLRYYPHYGRGYAQLTWLENYKRADDELGLGGELVSDLDLALHPDIAAQILVKGMERGWFTKKKLADYLPTSGNAEYEVFKQARRIINGTDKWREIAKIATKFQDALEAGGWA